LSIIHWLAPLLCRAYLADEYTLVTAAGCRPLQSADNRTCVVKRSLQPVRWPLFCHRRANAVEQSTWTASATGHHLRTIQTIVENVYVWLIGPGRLVSEC